MTTPIRKLAQDTCSKVGGHSDYGPESKCVSCDAIEQALLQVERQTAERCFKIAEEEYLNFMAADNLTFTYSQCANVASRIRNSICKEFLEKK